MAVFAAGAVVAAELATLSSTEAAVTVKTTPRGFSGTAWEFELIFDTHSGALNDELEKTATLVTDGGKSSPPVKWQGDLSGGHHRKVVLQFQPVSPRPTAVELRLARGGESQPRLFEWSLK